MFIYPIPLPPPPHYSALWILSREGLSASLLWKSGKGSKHLFPANKQASAVSATAGMKEDRATKKKDTIGSQTKELFLLFVRCFLRMQMDETTKLSQHLRADLDHEERTRMGAPCFFSFILHGHYLLRAAPRRKVGGQKNLGRRKKDLERESQKI